MGIPVESYNLYDARIRILPAGAPSDNTGRDVAVESGAEWASVCCDYEEYNSTLMQEPVCIDTIPVPNWTHARQTWSAVLDVL